MLPLVFEVVEEDLGIEPILVWPIGKWDSS